MHEECWEENQYQLKGLEWEGPQRRDRFQSEQEAEGDINRRSCD